MELILLIVIAALVIVLLILSLTKGNNQTQAEQLQTALRQQMQENREELNRSIRELRLEMTQTLNQNMQQLQDVLHKNMLTNGELQRQKFDMMARQQESLIKSTEKRLDDMRTMVEEKLQKTLNERIGQSFEIVRSQLENVQKGLGEMKSLAQDVGGLKKVLSNVKMRGTFGEVQLGALLEQMMSPEQYDANVKTKKSGTEFVEFAIKLPGKDDANSTVYLPIDAKFPKDVYEQYYDAFEAGDTALTGLAPIEFIKEIRIKRATQLIETGEFNMTQISYMVGINDPRYFSKCFKAQVGMTPTEYKEKVGR